MVEAVEVAVDVLAVVDALVDAVLVGVVLAVVDALVDAVVEAVEVAVVPITVVVDAVVPTVVVVGALVDARLVVEGTSKRLQLKAPINAMPVVSTTLTLPPMRIALPGVSGITAKLANVKRGGDLADGVSPGVSHWPLMLEAFQRPE